MGNKSMFVLSKKSQDNVTRSGFISSRAKRRSNICLTCEAYIGAVCAARSAVAQTVTIAETG